jgi:phage shock protein B
MEDVFLPIMIVGMLFIGLPWIIFHYVTKWRTAATLTNEDEAMLDQMNETARRLEDRLATIERIIAADNPDFRPSRPAAQDDDYTFDRRN